MTPRSRGKAQSVGMRTVVHLASLLGALVGVGRRDISASGGLVAVVPLAVFHFDSLARLAALAHGRGVPVGHVVLCFHWVSVLRNGASGSQIICGSLQSWSEVYGSGERTTTHPRVGSRLQLRSAGCEHMRGWGRSRFCRRASFARDGGPRGREAIDGARVCEGRRGELRPQRVRRAGGEKERPGATRQMRRSLGRARGEAKEWSRGPGR